MYTIEDAINDEARLGSLLMSERIPLQSELALLRRKAAALDWAEGRIMYAALRDGDKIVAVSPGGLSPGYHAVRSDGSWTTTESLLSAIEKAKEVSGE